MKKYICLIIIALQLPISAQQLRIGVFNDKNTKAIVFSVVQGNYLLTADNRAIFTFKPRQNMMVLRKGDSLQCIDGNKDLGVFQILKFNSMIDSGIFSIRPIEPKVDAQFYDDNLELSYTLGKLQTINIVDIDKYLAGVVEAEGGYKATSEYYKTQTVLCRTYALSHLDRHTEEGFFLCDGVHCQAFHGRNSGTPVIMKAAFDTRGLVVTDTDTSFITSAFFSNCGGETESAQNVWLLSKPYLKPVQDPYCQNQRNYSWDRKIPIDQWKQYLTSSGFKLKSDISPNAFINTQYSRKQYYKIGKDSLTYRRIRSDFKLKSAFFSFEIKGNDLVLHGRGYGHGVGLCQEGAMQMSKLGYNFREIIQFYYQGVNVTNFKDAPVSKNPWLKELKY